MVSTTFPAGMILSSPPLAGNAQRARDGGGISRARRQAAPPGYPAGPAGAGPADRQSSRNGSTNGDQLEEAGAVSRWEAPRIAYELAVEWAEKVEELAAGSGGVRGQRLRDVPLIGKAWQDLRTLERHDVLAALAAQTRSAIWEMRKHNRYADGQPLIVDIRYYGLKICEQAKETLRALTDPGGSDPWALPECAHCAGWVATALVDLEYNAILATGVDDPLAVLRMLVNTQEVPVQRKGDDDSGS